MTDQKIEATHTPGEWQWSGLQLLGDCSDDSCSPVLIAQGDPFDPSEADKALISAAPDLLEALRDVMGWIGAWDPNFKQDEEWPATNKKVLAALMKAEGRQP
jgi:hypothetical protein